jgi:ABC-type glycerol-3-phosphate transport system substrate-binding protein
VIDEGNGRIAKSIYGGAYMNKMIVVMLAMFLTLGSLLGCTSSEPKQAADSASSANGNVQDDGKEKLTINMMDQSNKGGGWPENAPVISKLNEALNIDLKIQWVPGDNYTEKMNVLAASNSFPDVYFVNDHDLYQKWQEKGLFLDVKPVLGSYPNLKKYISEGEYQILNPKGKYYGFPYNQVEALNSLMIRQDWLDKLHLKAPQTVDELYEVAKAFALNDPDGNGKADTVGLTFAVGQQGGFGHLAYLQGAFGLANGWKEAGGKLIPWQTQTEELKQLMAFLNKAYKEGVLDKDFIVNKNDDPIFKLYSGKVGIQYINANNLGPVVRPTFKQANPNGVLVQLTPPKGPTGLQATPTGTSGLTKVVINAKIDPKKQQRILKLLDYMLSDEGYNLIKNGIEGVHYKKVGDKYEKLPEYDKDRPFLLSTWFFRRDDPGIQLHLWDDQDYAKEVSTMIKENEKYRWVDAGAGLESQTATEISADLDTKLTKALVEVIVGKQPLDSIDKAVSAWKANGGDKIIAEMNAAYAKTK